MEDGKVSFAYKEYKQGRVTKEMTLDGLEFIRRYTLHVLIKGFVRIRHYGICSSPSKLKSAVVIKAQLAAPMVKPLATPTRAAPVPYNLKVCPCCKKEAMETLLRFKRRGPAVRWKEMATDLLAAIKAVEATVE